MPVTLSNCPSPPCECNQTHQRWTEYPQGALHSLVGPSRVLKDLRNPMPVAFLLLFGELHYNHKDSADNNNLLSGRTLHNIVSGHATISGHDIRPHHSNSSSKIRESSQEITIGNHYDKLQPPSHVTTTTIIISNNHHHHKPHPPPPQGIRRKLHQQFEETTFGSHNSKAAVMRSESIKEINATPSQSLRFPSLRDGSKTNDCLHRREYHTVETGENRKRQRQTGPQQKSLESTR